MEEQDRGRSANSSGDEGTGKAEGAVSEARGRALRASTRVEMLQALNRSREATAQRGGGGLAARVERAAASAASIRAAAATGSAAAAAAVGGAGNGGAAAPAHAAIASGGGIDESIYEAVGGGVVKLDKLNRLSFTENNTGKRVKLNKKSSDDTEKIDLLGRLIVEMEGKLPSVTRNKMLAIMKQRYQTKEAKDLADELAAKFHSPFSSPVQRKGGP